MARPEGTVLELAEFVDFAVATCLVYVLIVWLKDARARLALAGVSLVGACYLLAAEAGLTLTTRLRQAAFFISAVVLLLVFQEDLRRSFERLAMLVLRRGRTTPSRTAIDSVVRAGFALAAARRGALIVLPGREPIDRHVDGGVLLNGIVSEPLLLSLFDPHSPGHDGAVLLEADRVRQFAARLPLSSHSAQLGPRGTRHAAALGPSERCDATAVVVSEERGTVSVARRGELRLVTSPGDLAALLRVPSGPSMPVERAHRLPLRALRDLAGRMLLAAAVSLVLWVLVVPGSRVTRATLVVPVDVQNLPPGYDISSVSPRQVKVTVSGVRRALFFLEPATCTSRWMGS